MRHLLAILVVGLTSTATLAQPAKKTPDHFIPADAIVYVRYDGYEPHKKAYDKTALATAMKEGLGDFFEHVLEIVPALSRRLDDDEKPKKPGPEAAQFVDCLSRNGFVLGVELKSKPAAMNFEDMLHATVVFPHGAEKKNRAALEKFFHVVAGGFGVPVEISKISGRDVQSITLGGGDDQKAAWWPEGEHLVLAIGVKPVETAVLTIDGKKPSVAAAPWLKNLADAKYETDIRGRVDLAAIVNRFATLGLEEATLENLRHRVTRQLVLSHLGLTGLKDLTFQLGFEDKYQRSTVRLGVVEKDKRSGLLRLMAGPSSYGIDKVPALPPDSDYVCVRHMDWNSVYSFLKTSYGMKAFSDLLAFGELPKFPDLDRMVGGDFRKDLLEQLDTTIVCYGAHSEGPFFLGQGFAVKVKDATKVRKSLASLAKALGDQNEKLAPEKITYRGHPMYVCKKLPLPLTYTVHGDWLVFGLFPQPVQGFVMRSNGKYRTWKAPPEVEVALSKERANGRSQLVGVSVSDPRPAIEIGLSLMPVFMQTLNASFRTKILDVDKVPNAQSINEWLFPNVCLTYDDGDVIRWENQYSINEADDLLLFLTTPTFISALDVLDFLLPRPAPKFERIVPRDDPLLNKENKNPAIRPAKAVEKDGATHVEITFTEQVNERVIRKVPYTVAEEVIENGKKKIVQKTLYKEVQEINVRNVNVNRSYLVDGKEVQVTRKDGTKVDAKDLPKLLEKDARVLFVPVGSTPTAAMLDDLDERTLIVRIIAPLPMPMGEKLSPPPRIEPKIKQ